MIKSLYFDIGANVGKWSLANIKKCSKIIAVEPSPEVFKNLIINCKNNKNIKCLNYAVCNKDNEIIKFYENSCLSTLNKNWLCAKKSRFYKMPYKEIFCKTIKLDTLIKKYGKPDLIKVDVEGAEHLVISSLSQKVDTLCFEWAQEFPLVIKFSINHLLKLGFKKFYVQPDDRYLFIPEEKKYTEDLNEIQKKIMEKRTIIRKIDNMKIPAWGMIWAK